MHFVIIIIFFCFGAISPVFPLRKGVYYVPLGAGNDSLYWSVNYEKSVVQFEVHSILPRLGWFAIGFSDYGSFSRGDYCLLWTDWKWRTKLEDMWTDEYGTFQRDKQQDCSNFRVNDEKSVVKFTFIRNFDTCDVKDYILEDGTTHVIWLKGTSTPNSIGLNVNHAKERGVQRTQILKNPQLENIRLPLDTKTVQVTNDKVRVPENDTTYWCNVVQLPEYAERKHHIVKFESVIQPGNEALVHHMELFHCEDSPNVKISSYNGPCFAPHRPLDTQVCKKVLAAWAMGATPFLYPLEAGSPIGGKNYNPYVMLEVHYNNPEMKSDWVDSSGLRIYITPTLRKFDSGILELGLEYTDKMALPPGLSSFHLSGYCIAECTATSLPPRGIKIFGSQLHTHLTGVKVYTKHVRNGVELTELNRDNHYSTHFQEIRLLKKTAEILPGDALITTCHYNTESRDKVTLGGFAITDEMCVNYVHYYPKIDLEVCKSSISYMDLFDYFAYVNEWENQNTSWEKGISENYNSIEWTANRREGLSNLYDHSTLSMQCNSSSGFRFPGNWEMIPSTKIDYPLRPLPRACKENE